MTISLTQSVITHMNITLCRSLTTAAMASMQSSPYFVAVQDGDDPKEPATETTEDGENQVASRLLT